jgi:hypothetical protein
VQRSPTPLVFVGYPRHSSAQLSIKSVIKSNLAHACSSSGLLLSPLIRRIRCLGIFQFAKHAA